MRSVGGCSWPWQLKQSKILNDDLSVWQVAQATACGPDVIANNLSCVCGVVPGIEPLSMVASQPDSSDSNKRHGHTDALSVRCMRVLGCRSRRGPVMHGECRRETP